MARIAVIRIPKKIDLNLQIQFKVFGDKNCPSVMDEKWLLQSIQRSIASPRSTLFEVEKNFRITYESRVKNESLASLPQLFEIDENLTGAVPFQPIHLIALMESSQRLTNEMSEWLNNSIPWQYIQDHLGDHLSDTRDELTIVIQSEDSFWKFPWDTILNNNVNQRQVPIFFSYLEQYPILSTVYESRTVRIVTFADIPELKTTIKQIKKNLRDSADVLEAETLQDLRAKVSNGCEILLFSFHGKTIGGIAHIIYGEETLTVDAFARAIREGITKGLKILILACCDSISIAKNFADRGIYIPVIIAMDGKIPIDAASLFLTTFFDCYATQKRSLHNSFLAATQQIRDDWESKLPGTFRIPKLYQANILEFTPPTWQELIGSIPREIPIIEPPIVETQENTSEDFQQERTIPTPPRKSLLEQLRHVISQFFTYCSRQFVRNHIQFISIFLVVALLIIFSPQLYSLIFPPPPSPLTFCPPFPSNDIKVSWGFKQVYFHGDKGTPSQMVKAQSNFNDACESLLGKNVKNLSQNDIDNAKEKLNISITSFSESEIISYSKNRDHKTNSEIKIGKNNAELIKKYLDNAQLEISYHVLVVAVPLGTGSDSDFKNSLSTRGSANEISLGVAMAQKEFNDNHKNDAQGLLVLLLDDKSFFDTPSQLNKKAIDSAISYIKNIPNFTAVIGHFDTSTTQKVLPTYQENNIILMSSTATAFPIRDEHNHNDNRSLFRIVPQNKYAADAIIDSINGNKSVLILTPPTKNSYIQSMIEGLTKNTKLQSKEKKFSFEEKNLVLDSLENQSKLSEKYQAIILLPDSSKREQAITKAKEILKNERDLTVIGSDTMYNGLATTSNDCVNTLKVVVPYFNHSMLKEKLNNSFQIQAQTSWRIAYSYDAAKIFLDIINTSKGKTLNSDIVRQKLLDTKWSNTNEFLTGEISFENNGNNFDANKNEAGDRIVPNNYSELMPTVKFDENTKTCNFNFENK